MLAVGEKMKIGLKNFNTNAQIGRLIYCNRYMVNLSFVTLEVFTLESNIYHFLDIRRSTLRDFLSPKEITLQNWRSYQTNT